MKSILFVCLGNICRSPIAQGIAQKIIQDNSLDIAVDSAGAGSWHIGENPCKNSVLVAKNNGVDISKLVARQVTKEDFEKFDLVVALDSKNYSDLKAFGYENLVLLGDYGYDGADVPDPYFFDGFDGFDEVYKMCESCVIKLLS